MSIDINSLVSDVLIVILSTHIPPGWYCHPLFLHNENTPVNYFIGTPGSII